LEDLSPRAFEDSFAPAGMLHLLRVRAPQNKSKRALT
jgi:hypothetical protein